MYIYIYIYICLKCCYTYIKHTHINNRMQSNATKANQEQAKNASEMTQAYYVFMCICMYLYNVCMYACMYVCVCVWLRAHVTEVLLQNFLQTCCYRAPLAMANDSPAMTLVDAISKLSAHPSMSNRLSIESTYPSMLTYTPSSSLKIVIPR